MEALRNIHLTVRENEFLTILGPSGCGKTTLLRAIAGLVSVDRGQIEVDAVPIRGPGPERAMVFQAFALLPWRSVFDNIGFGLRLRGVPKAERIERVRKLVALVGLTGFEQRHPWELSGGMQQRVGLARALAVEPRYLLMDEPFGSLDEQTRRLMQEELLRIWEAARTTVVFITHSIEEAVLLGDRVVLMRAHPGEIEEIVPVPLARPRSAGFETMQRSSEFVSITADLWHHLREMQPPLQPAAATRQADEETA